MNGKPPPSPQPTVEPEDGSWVQTFTGRRFHPMKPRAEEVCIEDIAHALGNTCRFGGHVARFYSVAEHSWWVSQVVPKQDALWGLLHDAAEAYLVDVPTPVKPHIPGWDKVEQAVEQVIAKAFSLPWPMPQTVKEADKRILGDEQFMLMPTGGAEWRFTHPPLGIKVDCWPSYRAEAAFLNRFYELTGNLPAKAEGYAH